MARTSLYIAEMLVKLKEENGPIISSSTGSNEKCPYRNSVHKTDSGLKSTGNSVTRIMDLTFGMSQIYAESALTFGC